MIRSITDHDREEIYKLIKEEFDINYKCDTPFTHWYIYEEKKHIIGFINIDIIYDKSEIEYLYIRRENRKKKIATRLLQEIEKELKKNKIINITLEVNVNNKIAISFYEKNGFKKSSIRRKYYKNADAYLMLKELVV